MFRDSNFKLAFRLPYVGFPAGTGQEIHAHRALTINELFYGYFLTCHRVFESGCVGSVVAASAPRPASVVPFD